MKAAITDRLDTMYSQLVLILEIKKKKKTIETAKKFRQTEGHRQAMWYVAVLVNMPLHICHNLQTMQNKEWTLM